MQSRAGTLVAQRCIRAEVLEPLCQFDEARVASGVKRCAATIVGAIDVTAQALKPLGNVSVAIDAGGVEGRRVLVAFVQHLGEARNKEFGNLKVT